MMELPSHTHLIYLTYYININENKQITWRDAEILQLFGNQKLEADFFLSRSYKRHVDPDHGRYASYGLQSSLAAAGRTYTGLLLQPIIHPSRIGLETAQKTTEPQWPWPRRKPNPHARGTREAIRPPSRSLA